jgi:SagB-type dehydrogenase family enzyme
VDEAYRATWEWGEVAGLFHFGIKDGRFASDGERQDWIAARTAERPSPPLYRTNDDCAASTRLPTPQHDSGIFSTMRARRSRREFGAAAISLEALTHVVHSGLGITSFVDAGPLGILPFKMTPSGGARNPYEGFVLAANVEGLEPAIYHYSAVDNSLGLTREGPIPPPSRFLGNLEWADHSAAVVFLVADFSRTSWKYPHPAAYRVVLIEAGHIAQNMLLAATAFDLAATPIAAICNSVAESALGLDPIRQDVVHAVVLGNRHGT